MNHHIRIPADGTCKVCIIIERQAVVPHILGRIYSLGHGTYRYCLDQVLLAFSLYLIQQMVNTLGNIRLASVRFQLITETTDKRGKILHLVGIRQIVDTIYERFLGLPLRHFAYKLGNRTVCEQHKLLNHFIGIFRFLEIDTQRLAMLINLELHLVTFKRNSSFFETFGP